MIDGNYNFPKMNDSKSNFTPSIANRISTTIRKLINGNNEPRWFVFLNKLTLLPIVVWPFVFFTSIFIFDNPSNMGKAYLLFFGLNSYPFILLLLVKISYTIFKFNKVVAAAIPTLVLLTGLMLFIKMVASNA